VTLSRIVARNVARGVTGKPPVLMIVDCVAVSRMRDHQPGPDVAPQDPDSVFVKAPEVGVRSELRVRDAVLGARALRIGGAVDGDVRETVFGDVFDVDADTDMGGLRSGRHRAGELDRLRAPVEGCGADV